MIHDATTVDQLTVDLGAECGKDLFDHVYESATSGAPSWHRFRELTDSSHGTTTTRSPISTQWYSHSAWSSRCRMHPADW